ncbi:hypothetical protein [Actinokineospora inagensis]|uniref:hypothetical protein n=1 Tax=Actinokineospora inagensis TaxID=103730 RepID=UPI00040F80CF|nr:hypothetical protein [Actinokineospora inagensis]
MPPDRAEAERLALAALCAALPDLRPRAARGFWEDALDMHVAEVAGGGSAVAACRELGLQTDVTHPPNRGEDPADVGVRTDWLPSPTLVGDYRCPGRHCARRADRDEQARPPRCAIFDEPMRFVRGNTG